MLSANPIDARTPMRLAISMLLLTFGCGGGAISAVRGQAVHDMACAEPDVKVTPATTASGAPTDSGLYYAEGCKQVRRYYVGCNVFGMCTEPDGINVLELVQRQAGFDLKCDGSTVAVQRLNTDTFGATGCDRQVSYVLLCRGHDCRVVQNSQTQ